MMKYKADFLWPHENGSIEEAGYEFANGQTESYQKVWWDILLVRLKSNNVLHANNKESSETEVKK